MSTLDDLRAGRALIAEPRRWAQEHYAYDRDGVVVASRDPRAVCWCALGALRRQDIGEESDAFLLLREASYALFNRPVSDVNDEIGHAAILRVYDRAIELAEARS